MKHRIIENLTGLADIFGWKLPKWALRNVSPDQLDSLRQREDALTEALRSGKPRSHEMPAFLETRIEQAIDEADRHQAAYSWRSLLLLPGTALAAILLVAIFLSNNIQQEPPSGPGFKLERAVAVNNVETQPVGASLERVVDRITDFKKGAEAESLLVQPLAEEPKRLAADVTSALRIVAQSVLPESYLGRVNRNLDSLEEEVGKSI